MRPSAAAQLGLSLGERFGRPFAIARAAPPRDQKQSSGLWLPHCCDWAIAQVRGSRQRAAADCWWVRLFWSEVERSRLRVIRGHGGGVRPHIGRSGPPR